MPEWWTYRLSDFLLFSPRTYYRTIERLNETLWPVHLLTLILGGMILVLLLRRRAVQPRIIWLTMALLWSWIAWAFLWRRYSTINWAAVYLVPLFALEALLLIRESLSGRKAGNQLAGRTRATGWLLLSLGIAFYPAMAPLLGRGWEQAEVFGMAPDPTAIATLGLVLLVPSRRSGWLMVVPVVWCLISGLTLWAMESPEAWVPPAAAVLSVLPSWLPKAHSTAGSESGAAV